MSDKFMNQGTLSVSFKELIKKLDVLGQKKAKPLKNFFSLLILL